MMQLCSRCRKRMAVVFVTKLENGESQNEGLCLKCARELGIPQMDSMLSNMGISDQDLDNMEDEIGNLLSQVSEGGEEDDDDDIDGDDAASRTPALDFAKLFGSLPFMNNNAPKNEENVPAKKEDGSKTESSKGKSKDKDKKKKEKERRYLSMYCRDLTAAAKEGKLDAVIGRERETARMMQILSRRQKNNP